MRKIITTLRTNTLNDPGMALFGVDATRRIEQRSSDTLAPHTLMARAGLAVARLAMALTPHARCIWVACGPGNNGGDGLQAAIHLHQWGRASGLKVIVTCVNEGQGSAKRPPDAQAAYDNAIAAGVTLQNSPPAFYDLSIDALLGLGATYKEDRPGNTQVQTWLAVMHTGNAPCLAVDLPTWLDANTGSISATSQSLNTLKSIASPALFTRANERFTLALLTLKPGLFTASGRDAAGEVWFDDLGVSSGDEAPSAWLTTDCGGLRSNRLRNQHASHKGSFGDVAVVGGESTAHSQMAGAALLAARAALHAGAGRVFVSLLTSPTNPAGDGETTGVAGANSMTLTLDGQQPELMFRAVAALDVAHQVVVCGCGGGSAVQAVLPMLMDKAVTLVLDADALNAIADNPALQAALVRRGQSSLRANTEPISRTVLTPHPLEAARLLGTSTAAVQADRLAAAQRLADRFGAVVVLKGSGTVVTAPDGIPRINASGNALLATAGTGDVLAGVVGAYLARHANALEAACAAVFDHGCLADEWTQPEATSRPRLLTASRLAAQCVGQ